MKFCTIIDPKGKAKDIEVGDYSSVLYPPSTLKKVGTCSTVIRAHEGVTEVGDNCYIHCHNNDQYFEQD